MAKTIEIPTEVVNRKKYIEYLMLTKHPTIVNRVYTTSEGEELNLAMFHDKLANKIRHLPPKEQEIIWELKGDYQSMLIRKNHAKAMAYGNERRPNEPDPVGHKRKRSAHEHDIVELLGKMFTTKEVVRVMGEEVGVVVDEKEVKAILQKHVVEIEKRREKYRNEVSDVRLYNKRARLEELTWMYSQIRNRWVNFKGLDAYAMLLRTLEQIRKEAEGDVINVNASMDVNVNLQIQNYIQKEILKTINLKEIILGRVAARMGYDYVKLIAGLHNSYYAKFTLVSGEYNTNSVMNYPSLMSYDFTAIEHTIGNRDDVIDIKAEVVTDDEVLVGNSIKDIMKRKIAEQKADFTQRVSKTANVYVDDEITFDRKKTKEVNVKTMRTKNNEWNKHNRAK